MSEKNGSVDDAPVSTISKSDSPPPYSASEPVEGRSGQHHHAEDDWSSTKVLRNLLLISSAFFLLFTAFMGLSNLQSSINCDEGLGVASLATIYATLIFSALTIPSFVIKHLGIKWTLAAAMCCYTVYSASNFYPSWYTLIPASVLLGLAGAPLWSSKCTYLTTIGGKFPDQVRHQIWHFLWAVNCDAGLGVASLATIYATLIISSLTIPSFVINHLGIKWTLAASMCCYTIYCAVNFYPDWYTLIPASVLLGLAGAPLWSSKCTYLTTIGMRYAVITGETRDVIVSRFFGIFFVFFQASQVLGNLISSLVFSQGDNNSTAVNNFTCGSMYCYSDGGDDNATSICEATKPAKDLTNIVIGIYTACGACAVLIIVLGVDPLQASEKNQTSNTMELITATVRLMMQKKLLLLIPITMVSGLEQAFMQGDFTKSFITCKIGVQFVGYVLICYGLVDASASFLSGRFEKYTGRIPQFSMAALINIALMITMTMWEPTEDLPVYFVIAAFWGLADAVWQTQLNAYYGVLFPFNQEPAFSNYRLWESAGYTISFAYSNFLCIWTKMLILTCFLGVGMSGYFVTEFDRQKVQKLQAQQQQREMKGVANTNFEME